jgi:hypothetical protein
LGYTGAELLNTNRIFQFDNGERIFAINQVVVFGSGPYQKYEGSTFLEDVISADPDYVTNITLSLMLLTQPRMMLLLPVVMLCYALPMRMDSMRQCLILRQATKLV